MRAFPVFQEVTLEPPATGAHFSGLSLKKMVPMPCGFEVN
jgi:hypothetical protein